MPLENLRAISGPTFQPFLEPLLLALLTALAFSLSLRFPVALFQATPAVEAGKAG